MQTVPWFTSAVLHVFFLAVLLLIPTAIVIDESVWKVDVQRGEPITLQVSLTAAETDPSPAPTIEVCFQELIPPPPVELTAPARRPDFVDVSDVSVRRPAAETVASQRVDVITAEPTRVESEVRQREPAHEAIEPPPERPLPRPRKTRRPPVITPATAMIPPQVENREAGAKYDEPPRKLRNNPAPDYPLAARRTGAQGRVLLRVQISQAGRVEAVRLEQSCGHPALDAAAMAAVRTWSFAPARKGGRAVSSEVRVPVRFSLRSR